MSVSDSPSNDAFVRLEYSHAVHIVRRDGNEFIRIVETLKEAIKDKRPRLITCVDRNIIDVISTNLPIIEEAETRAPAARRTEPVPEIWTGR
jgi:hypothetical protein